MILQKAKGLSKVVYFGILVIAAIIAYSFIINSHTKLSAETTSCGNLPPSLGYFTGADYTNEVYCTYHPGQDVSDNTFSSADTNPATFIKDALGSRAASFYVDLMLGKNKDRPATSSDIAEWKAEINSPDIGIKVDNDIKDSTNSLYIPAANDYFFYSVASPVDVPTLVFYNKHTSATYTMIKIDCGNPLNSLALPAPSVDHPPTGRVELSCSGGGQAIIELQDSEGSTPGYIQIGSYKSPAHGSGYVYNISQYVSWSNQTVDLYAQDIGPGGSGDYILVDSGSVGPCASTGCGTTNLPSSLAIGVPQTFHVSMTYSGPSPPPTLSTFSITISGPGGQTYPSVGAQANSGLITSSPDQTFTPTTPGNYMISWTYKGQNCSAYSSLTGSTGVSGYQPYFSVSGGDIAAGPGFCGATTPDPSAEIIGYNTDDSPSSPPTYAGAGSELGALALLDIKSFATAQGSSNTGSLGGSLNPSALAFANNSVTGTTYGNGFYSTSAAATASDICVPDYYSSANATSPLSSATIDPGSLNSGVYSYTGSATINGATPIPNNDFVTVKVNGNVYINGNIGYNSYTTLDQIPRFTLLVSGNIYIAPSVTQLSGFYVAESSGTGTGIIATCANTSGPIGSSDPNAYDHCGSSLTIDGAVAAAQIIPGRTYGNLVATGSISGSAAETFQYSPELWLAGLHNPQSLGGSINAGAWQSITSLPPIL